MSERLKGVTVVFEDDIRDEDAQAIINAIQMVKGVLHVEPSLSTHDDFMARVRVKSEMAEKIFDVIKTF